MWVLVVLGLIALSLRYPGFGKLMLLVGAAIIVSVVGYYVNEDHQEDVAKTLVHANQLEMTDVGLGGSNGSYRITGRVKNNSSYTVNDVTVKVDVKDCGASGRCDTVGEEPASLGVTVPAGQVRDFDESVYFPDMQIRGSMQWDYVITGITAKP